MTSRTSDLEELEKRAQKLLDQDGVWVSNDQKELNLSGWSRWPIIVVNFCADDLHRTTYLLVFYDHPTPAMVFSNDPNDAGHPPDHDGMQHLPTVLGALRRRMLLDDLADV